MKLVIEIKGRVMLLLIKSDKGNTDMNEDVLIFHAGTRLENRKYYTSGGRVTSGVTALGGNLESAVKRRRKLKRYIFITCIIEKI